MRGSFTLVDRLSALGKLKSFLSAPREYSDPPRYLCLSSGSPWFTTLRSLLQMSDTSPRTEWNEAQDLPSGQDRTFPNQQFRGQRPGTSNVPRDVHGRAYAGSAVPSDLSLPYLTPHMGDGHGVQYPSGDGHRSAPTPSPYYAPMPPWMGDGHSASNEGLPSIALALHGLADETQGAALIGRRPSPAPKAELWKLLMLVVFFVIWITTASTLLFLYMDRYLFPG